VIDVRNTATWRMAWHALPVYVLSRLCVLAGAAVVAAELRVDENLAGERNIPISDPHVIAPPSLSNSSSAVRPMIDVLTSWDGQWYMDIVRDGYPSTVPNNVTYHMDQARAAFFPLFPMLGKAADTVLPGGDTMAVLVLNTVLGFIAVVLIGLLAQRIYGERVGRTATTLIAMFPGSFVLSFAYSEALMLVLAAAVMICLFDRRWLLAGVFAALTTATRPNGVAIVLACAVAAFMAIREERDWRALSSVLLAPIGFIVFQIWLGQHTGEAGVWFRVQREAWDEGASFGWTAITNTVEAIAQPLTSPTDTVTAVSVVVTVIGLWMAWRARLPIWMTVYSWTVIALMLAPATVTARPRFLFTAFPVFIGAALWYEQRHRTDDRSWAMTMAACGAGLAALTGLYGVFGAIP
jgi:Dolichyl-phosphate-mannose-protein mannosyltransferase